MATDPLIGQQIGNYRVVDLIGRGGMGSVYLAENPGIKRQVAIKVLLPHLSLQQDYLQRFKTEASAIARINHPGVVEIYDFGRTPNGSSYYVMELLRGRGLDQLLAERERLTPAEILPVLVQICAALDAAHQAGVVHRDLKLDNIFVMDRTPLQVKLLDFGVAKLLDPGQQSHMQTSVGLLIGTPTFMAPEQAAGRSEQVGPQTDLYALGVVLFFLLTGKAPFRANTAPELMVKHLHEPPPRLRQVDPDLPVALEQLIERCLAKRPQDRPSSAGWVAASFAAALQQSKLPPQKTVVVPDELVAAGPLSPLSQSMTAIMPDQAGYGVTSSFAKPEQQTALERPVVVERQRSTAHGRSSGGALDATHAKIAELATRSAITREHHRSTLSGASGELRLPPGRANRLLTALLLGGAVGVVAGLLLFLWPREQATEPPAPASVSSLPLVQPLLEQPVALQPTVQVRVLGDDPQVTCRYVVARGSLQSARLPCRIEVAQGQELWLELTRDGVRVWAERWLIEKERELSAEDLVRQHLPVGAGAESSAADRSLIHSPPKKRAAAPHQRRRSLPKKMRARPKKVRPPRKLPPERVGSGTLDF